MESDDKCVIRRAGEIELRFAKLTPRDRADMLREAKARRKRLLIANLQSAQIDKEQALVELEAFDDRPWGQARWLDHLNTLEGQAQAVDLAWSRINPGAADAAIDAVESGEGGLIALAAEVCNLRLTYPPAPDSSGEEDATNPTPPRSAD